MSKRCLRWALLCVVLLLAAGCAHIDIEGTWRSGEIDNASYWVFRPDGKMTITSGLITMQGTYTLKGHKLNTVQDRPIVYDVSLRDDELTLQNSDETSVLYRVKE